jgi:hypothetical protein
MGLATFRVLNETKKAFEKPRKKRTFAVEKKPSKTIMTAQGEAKYVRTDIEDEHERWRGMNLYTRDGFWVIHEGKKHHIYQSKI